MQSEETWMELHVLRRHGWSIAALAREFGLNWRTARRYATTQEAPRYRPRARPAELSAAQVAHVERRLAACPDLRATVLLRELVEGYGYTSLRNVEFREGILEALPVPNDWADVVISNGVLNLVPDKAAALAEFLRVLHPGGRIQLADIVLDRPVPGGSKSDVSLWTGCIAGGLLADELLALVKGAGFRDVEVRRGADVFDGAPQHSNAADFGTVGAGITGRKP